MNSPIASATSAAPRMGADLIPAGTARLLVGGGLLPFATLSGGSVVMDGAHAALFHYPLVAYGAVILSFVGALHWGIALSHPAASLRDPDLWWGALVAGVGQHVHPGACQRGEDAVLGCCAHVVSGAGKGG